ncbi:MAG: hypothetical protein ACRDUY_11200 [Nitriliruptorales bacterium]
MNELRDLDPEGRREAGEPFLEAWAGDEPHQGPRRWDLESAERPGGRGGRRRHVILAAAVAPWLVVAIIVFRPAAPAVDGREHVAEAEPASPLPEPRVTPDGPGAVLAPEAFVVGARVAPGAAEAAAVAVAVTRSWLGDAAPALDLGLGTSGIAGYLEHVVVESVDLPLPDLAVVSLLAVMLDAEDDVWTGARTLRLAVPVRLSPEAASPAGSPWLLPAPDLSIDAPDWIAVDDPVEMAAAGAALVAAGYRDVSVDRLERSESWPLRATVTAVAPGAAEPAEHTVWLRRHLGDYVVAGLLPSAHVEGEVER